MSSTSTPFEFFGCTNMIMVPCAPILGFPKTVAPRFSISATLGRCGIEVAGRLVRDHKAGIVCQRTGNSDALLFTAGKLGRLVMQTLGEADLLRRAMGKKKLEEMIAQRKRFVEGA